MWGATKGEWTLVETGENLVELATEDDVAPDIDMLMVTPTNPNRFHKVRFHPKLEWDNVVELINAKRVYKYGNKRTISETEGTQLRAADPGLL